MNRKVYKLFKPLFDILKRQGYKEPVIRLEKLIFNNGGEDLFLEIYFQGDVEDAIELSKPYPKGFELWNNDLLDDKIGSEYQVRLSKLYLSEDVFESEIVEDIKVLVDWASRLGPPILGIISRKLKNSSILKLDPITSEDLSVFG